MSAPRTKRQFAGAASDPAQRQITTFFSPSSPSDSANSPSSQQQQQPLQQPRIPPGVQTNLLSVGMRVRKSVPEGYKTSSPYSGFKLWSDVDNRRVSVSPSPATASSSSPASSVSSQRELLPFCGIHSTGGLSPQPVFSPSSEELYGMSSANSMLHVPDLDDIPGLTSSQETVEDDDERPVRGGTSRSRKRIFDHDDDEGQRNANGTESTNPALLVPSSAWKDRQAWMEGEVSPRSLAPVGWGNARPIAVPRRQGRRKGMTSSDGAGGAATTRAPAGYLEQENVAMGDFEEADFLVGEGMDTSEA